MKINKLSLYFLLCFATFSTTLLAQENTKEGFSFGLVPVVAYDSDIGFKYGGLTNLYWYGDGSTYPKYRHSLYLEWSRTTKGSGINQIIYDTEFLIPNVRMTLETSLFTEKAVDFYGFNGYEAWYNPEFENQESADYLSRLYYRHERKLARVRMDFQGKISDLPLRWYAGIDYYGNKVSDLDYNKLNADLDEEDKLPIDTSLFFDFVKWGAIADNEKDGGNITYLKLGLVYDTRDNEPNPNSGIWTELLLLAAPKLSKDGFSYSRIAFTHRQYITLVPKRLTFAYRASYQGLITGNMPFFMLPFVYNTNITRDGLGGAKTIRGVLRNRIVGNDFAYSNIELRWKFLKKVIFRQNFYISLNTFFDAGMVTRNYEYNTALIPQNYFAATKSETLHLGYGLGVRLALNDNFVVAVDYGMAAKEEDGDSGVYIGMNFLF